MTTEEQRRAMVLTGVVAGEWTVQEGATTLGRSERPVRRLMAAYVAHGPAALVHGNRGRSPAHALDAPTRSRVVALARERYTGFTDQHFTEKLATDELDARARDRAAHPAGGGHRQSPHAATTSASQPA